MVVIVALSREATEVDHMGTARTSSTATVGGITIIVTITSEEIRTAISLAASRANNKSISKIIIITTTALKERQLAKSVAKQQEAAEQKNKGSVGTTLNDGAQ